MANSAYRLSRSKNNVEAVGTKDGVNDTFTVPNSDSYVLNTLEVFLNGQLYAPGSITQNGPGYTTFTIGAGETIPEASDVLTCSYSVA